MNYLEHPNLLVQFWASLNTEFDKLLDRFVRMDGWLFQDLGIAAKEANIGRIHRCVCALANTNHGMEDRLDHFVRVNLVILDAAKTQWLVPWRRYVVDPSNGVIPPFLKRQVGGFFLLYMLYISQPLANRFQRKQKIIMGTEDLLAMHVFNTTLQRLPKTDDQFRELARQVVALFNDLVKSGAFEFNAFNDTFITPTHSIRKLLASKLCMFTDLIYSVKDLRDQLYYITHQESRNMFQSLVVYGRSLPENKKKTKARRDKKGTTDQTDREFHPADKKWTLQEIKALENENDIGKLAHSVTCILKSLDFGPILTRERMTGISNNLLDRELRNCVNNHHSYLQRVTDGVVRARRSKHSSQTASGRNPKSELDTLKKYFSRNYDWIDDIFLSQHKTDAEPSLSQESDAHPSSETHDLDEIIDAPQRGNEENDDEWMTDDGDTDDDIEMAELKDVTYTSPKTKRVALSSTTTPSPRRRSQRFQSMPTIL